MIREVLTLEALQRLEPHEAAALLLVRQDSGDGDLDDAVLDAWLAADEAHVDAWTRAATAWQAFEVEAASSETLQSMRDAALANDRPNPRFRWGFAAAASIAVLAASGGALLLSRPDAVESTQPRTELAGAEAGVLQLVTATGEHRSFTLADRSVVTLNTDSAVTVAFRAGGERRLALTRGQAFFQVAHDRSRPFVVSAFDRTVTALGTAFEVRLDRRAVRVVLVEGRVSVGHGTASPVALRAGQQLVADDSGTKVSAADVAAVEDWQRGVVTFKGTTLAAAAAEMNRYSTTQLVVDDPRVARLKVSGVFHTDDARRFAQTIEQIYPVKVIAAAGGASRIVPASPVI